MTLRPGMLPVLAASMYSAAEQRVHRACALIETKVLRPAVENSGQLVEVRNCGSGFLVNRQQLVTCWHTIHQAIGPIEVRFGHRVAPYFATVVAQNEHLDFAILSLSADDPLPDDLKPLTLSPQAVPLTGAHFWSYGFPALLYREGSVRGLTIGGQIQALSPLLLATREECVPLGSLAVFQLYSHNAGAGSGGRLQGMSGSPLLVGNHVVGILIWVIPEQNTKGLPPAGQLGVVYACPIEYLRPELAVQHTDVAPIQTISPATRPDFDRALYTSRLREEEQALQHLNIGTPAFIWGPGRVGKTTVLQYLFRHVYQELVPPNLDTGVATQPVCVDFSVMEQASFASLDQCLKAFGRSLTTGIVDAQTWQQWQAEAWASGFSDIDRFNWAMANRILPAVSGMLIICLLQTERLLTSAPPGSSLMMDFFGMIKGWAGLYREPPWDRLRLLIEFSSESKLISSFSNPANGINKVELRDFDAQQIKHVVHLYRLSATTRCIQDILRLTGGHPFLVYSLLHAAATLPKTTPRQNAIRQTLREYAAQRHDPRSTIFSEEYRCITESLLRGSRQGPELISTIRGLLRGSATVGSLEVAERLYEGGLLKVHRERGYVPRNQVYADFLQHLIRSKKTRAR